MESCHATQSQHHQTEINQNVEFAHSTQQLLKAPALAVRWLLLKLPPEQDHMLKTSK